MSIIGTTFATEVFRMIADGIAYLPIAPALSSGTDTSTAGAGSGKVFTGLAVAFGTILAISVLAHAATRRARRKRSGE